MTTKYQIEGFQLFDTGLEKLIKKTRIEFIKLFNLVSQHNGLHEIKSDAQIQVLYNRRKDLWIAAYDQLRFLPQIYEIACHPNILVIVKKLGLKAPAFGAKLVVRADMPFDNEFNFMHIKIIPSILAR